MRIAEGIDTWIHPRNVWKKDSCDLVLPCLLQRMVVLSLIPRKMHRTSRGQSYKNKDHWNRKIETEIFYRDSRRKNNTLIRCYKMERVDQGISCLKFNFQVSTTSHVTKAFDAKPNHQGSWSRSRETMIAARTSVMVLNYESMLE